MARERKHPGRITERLRLGDLGSLIGETLGGIEVRRRLGRGGMAEVFLGHDPRLAIEVAVKVLSPSMAKDPDVHQRFLQEAQAIAKLDHPNVIRILRVGQDKGLAFFVMEAVRGSDVYSTLCVEGSLPPVRAATIALAAAEALRYAHKKGVIHRDIKPHNILVSDNLEQIKLVDFGLARITKAAEHRLTTIGTQVGTPFYMSPEQIRGKSVDHRCDIFSLGITLFEMAFGDVPFLGDLKEFQESADYRKKIEIPPNLLEEDAEFFINLARGMCAADPHDRMSSSEIIHRLQDWLEATGHSYETVDSTTQLLEGSGPPAIAETSIIEVDSGGTNLHRAVGGCFGREHELQELHKLIDPEHQQGPVQSRLVSVVGSAGVGTTRIVQQYAEAHLTAFFAGTWFVDCSEVHDAHDLCAAVAGIFDAPLQRYRRDEQIRDALTGRCQRSGGELLMILDGLNSDERSILETIRLWCSACAEVSIIVTGEAPLGLEKERVLEISPLRVPYGDSTYTSLLDVPLVDLQVLEENPGVRLFIDVAQRRGHGVGYDEDELILIGEICRLVQGMPLLIEFCAGMAMRQRLRYIMVGIQTAIDEAGEVSDYRTEHTSQAVLDWLWQRLDPVERSALAQLTAFRGTFPQDGAHEVVAHEITDRELKPNKLVLQLELLNLLLVHRISRLDGEIRLEIPLLLRWRARAELQRHGKEASALGFVEDWWLNTYISLWRHRRGRRSHEIRYRLTHDEPALVAIAASRRHAPGQVGWAATVVHDILADPPWLSGRGAGRYINLLRAAITRGGMSLRGTRRVPHHADPELVMAMAVSASQAMASCTEPIPDAVLELTEKNSVARARVLTSLAWAHFTTDQPTSALRRLERARTILESLREASDNKEIDPNLVGALGDTWLVEANVLMHQNHIGASIDALTVALQHYQTIHDARHQVECLVLLSDLELQKGEPEKALSHCQRAQVFTDKLYSSTLQAYVDRAMARAYLVGDSHYDALRMAFQSLEHAQQHGALIEQEASLRLIALINREKGDVNSAETYTQLAEEMADFVRNGAIPLGDTVQ